MKHFRRNKREKLLENPWYAVYRDDIHTETGHHFPEYYVIDVHQPVAAAVIVNKKNELLFVEPFRYPIDRISLEIPAGSADSGESLQEAAVRECLEETGYEVQIEGTGYDYFPSNGISNQRFVIFFGRVIDEAPQKAYDQAEIAAVRWLSIETVKEKIANNEIKDGLTLTALLLFLSM
ncbi:NUDIX hydrolase [Enterococcus sp. LJL51]|uniref:NUDIX hydrolase n=1 Tax=Enterococcus sp. LJL51 TaxID=3416656 RepID=UPI003CEA796F